MQAPPVIIWFLSEPHPPGEPCWQVISEVPCLAAGRWRAKQHPCHWAGLFLLWHPDAWPLRPQVPHTTSLSDSARDRLKASFPRCGRSLALSSLALSPRSARPPGAVSWQEHSPGSAAGVPAPLLWAAWPRAIIASFCTWASTPVTGE